MPAAGDAPSLYQPPLEDEYRIGAGDALLIDSYYMPTLKQPVIVREDGRFAPSLVGEIMAAGKTPAELGRELTAAYSQHLGHTDVTISVQELADDTVYVGGQVNTPAILSARGQITLLQAIIGAGGFTAAANMKQVLIVRPTEDKRYKVFQQNADAVLHNQTDELYLRRHDIIYVLRSRIAEVDQFVDQYINQIVPKSLSTGVGYQSYNKIR